MRERWRHILTDRQTERERERETLKERERQTRVRKWHYILSD